MFRTLVAIGLLPLCLSVAAVFGEEPPPDDPAKMPSIQVVKLAPQKPGATARALKYHLLPDPLDQIAGNAAPFWLRAGIAARGVRTKLDEKQWKWTSASETALRDLPRQEVRTFLAHYAKALQLAEAASLRDRCDWELPTLTVQNLTQMPLDEVQSFREIANLLNLRCRLELAEGNFDQALRTLRIGFSLARHVGESETMIHNLVGIAIASIMLGCVEEMIQLPGSPNLYWPLSHFPSPLIDCRQAIRSELNTLHRSFPQLREVARGPLSVEQVNHLADDFTRSLGQLSDRNSLWPVRLGLAALAVKLYPDAKANLIARGRTVDEIEAMPALQVVILHMVEQSDDLKDEYLKWMSLPPWQMWAGLQQNERKIHDLASRDNPIIGLLMPAVSKVIEAQMRLGRNLAGLRTAEALRMYAARHKGQPPEKLNDVQEVPLPLDPYTGKSFDASYALQEGRGVLEIKAPANLPIRFGRRFEQAPLSDK
jgi:hypothetical protein